MPSWFLTSGCYGLGQTLLVASPLRRSYSCLASDGEIRVNYPLVFHDSAPPAPHSHPTCLSSRTTPPWLSQPWFHAPLVWSCAASLLQLDVPLLSAPARLMGLPHPLLCHIRLCLVAIFDAPRAPRSSPSLVAHHPGSLGHLAPRGGLLTPSLARWVSS